MIAKDIINKEIINFANHLADSSGEVIKKYFRQEIGEENKSNQTPVTIVDREVEMLIRENIIKEYPSHGMVGEEHGNINDNADYKWVIDPIDGTISFVMGRPIFGTLIALSYKNQPVLGIINQPITGERWLGVINQGSTFNGKKIKTRSCQNLSEAIFCSTSPHFLQDQDWPRIKKIATQTKYQSQGGIIYGGDCYLFGLLASGLIDIIVEKGLNNYDFMALVPVVKAAGGEITDWQGKELNINSDGTIIACGSKALHQKVLGLMQEEIV